MKNKWTVKIGFVFALSTLVSGFASADDKGLNGGGGEVEFHSIEAELVTWMNARFSEGTLDQKLDLKDSGVKITRADLYAKFQKAVSDVGN